MEIQRYDDFQDIDFHTLPKETKVLVYVDKRQYHYEKQQELSEYEQVKSVKYLPRVTKKEPEINLFHIFIGGLFLAFILSFIGTSLEYNHRERMEIYRGY